DVAPPLFEHRHATQNEGAHQELAELWVRLDELAQPVVVHFDRVAVFEHDSAVETLPPSEEVELAREATGPDRREVLALVVRVDGCDLARQHDEERPMDLTLLEKNLTTTNVATRAAR